MESAIRSGRSPSLAHTRNGPRAQLRAVQSYEGMKAFVATIWQSQRSFAFDAYQNAWDHRSADYLCAARAGGSCHRLFNLSGSGTDAEFVPPLRLCSHVYFDSSFVVWVERRAWAHETRRRIQFNTSCVRWGCRPGLTMVSCSGSLLSGRILNRAAFKGTAVQSWEETTPLFLRTRERAQNQF